MKTDESLRGGHSVRATLVPRFYDRGQLIYFSKNVATWGGLLFIAGTGNQPGSPGAHHNG
jgi:hypothetical protein